MLQVHAYQAILLGGMMQHTHSYVYWYSHRHNHAPETSEESVAVLGSKGLKSSYHDGGHSHLFAASHEHGKNGATPHSHKERQWHPLPSDVVHHHAVNEHLVEVK